LTRIKYISYCKTFAKLLKYSRKEIRFNILITFNEKNNFKNLRSEKTLKRKTRTLNAKISPSILVTTSKRERTALERLDTKPIAVHVANMSTTPLRPPQSCAKMHSTSMKSENNLANVLYFERRIWLVP